MQPGLIRPFRLGWVVFESFAVGGFREPKLLEAYAMLSSGISGRRRDSIMTLPANRTLVHNLQRLNLSRDRSRSGPSPDMA